MALQQQLCEWQEKWVGRRPRSEASVPYASPLDSPVQLATPRDEAPAGTPLSGRSTGMQRELDRVRENLQQVQRDRGCLIIYGPWDVHGSM